MSGGLASGRVALVTGGAKRIGAVLCKSLAADGWTVVIHYNRSYNEAEDLAAEIEGFGGLVTTVRANLCSRADTESLVPTCVSRHGRLDLLVNNAAEFTYDSLKTLSWDSFDRHWTANLAAPLLLSRDFCRAQESGADRCIVNILDQKVANLSPDFLSYTVSKLALASVTELLAEVLVGQVRVNGIAPGWTLRGGKQTDEQFKRVWHSTPLGRSTSPEEIARCLKLILASPSMVGQILYLDGGQSLAGRAERLF